MTGYPSAAGLHPIPDVRDANMQQANSVEINVSFWDVALVSKHNYSKFKLIHRIISAIHNLERVMNSPLSMISNSLSLDHLRRP